GFRPLYKNVHQHTFGHQLPSFSRPPTKLGLSQSEQRSIAGQDDQQRIQSSARRIWDDRILSKLGKTVRQIVELQTSNTHGGRLDYLWHTSLLDGSKWPLPRRSS